MSQSRELSPLPEIQTVNDVSEELQRLAEENLNLKLRIRELELIPEHLLMSPQVHQQGRADALQELQRQKDELEAQLLSKDSELKRAMEVIESLRAELAEFRAVGEQLEAKYLAAGPSHGEEVAVKAPDDDLMLSLPPPPKHPQHGSVDTRSTVDWLLEADETLARASETLSRSILKIKDGGTEARVLLDDFSSELHTGRILDDHSDCDGSELLLQSRKEQSQDETASAFELSLTFSDALTIKGPHEETQFPPVLEPPPRSSLGQPTFLSEVKDAVAESFGESFSSKYFAQRMMNRKQGSKEISLQHYLTPPARHEGRDRHSAQIRGSAHSGCRCCAAETADQMSTCAESQRSTGSDVNAKGAHHPKRRFDPSTLKKLTAGAVGQPEGFENEAPYPSHSSFMNSNLSPATFTRVQGSRSPGSDAALCEGHMAMMRTAAYEYRSQALQAWNTRGSKMTN